jgi:ribonuclease HI
MGKPKKYYAVARGRNPGIYTAWFGPSGAEAQIRGYPGARYKGFPAIQEAREWMENQERVAASAKKRQTKLEQTGTALDAPGDVRGKILVYTDGGSRGNPGPGGYGAVILDGETRTELSQGFRLTTNNRMELMACIAALEALAPSSDLVLHSDSRYVVNGMNRGWAERWRANNWMRTPQEAAENADLWARLLDLCEDRRVRFVWVRGHAGHEENERCDALATAAAAGAGLEEDSAYVQGRTKITPSLFDEED